MATLTLETSPARSWDRLLDLAQNSWDNAEYKSELPRYIEENPHFLKEMLLSGEYTEISALFQAVKESDSEPFHNLVRDILFEDPDFIANAVSRNFYTDKNISIDNPFVIFGFRDIVVNGISDENFSIIQMGLESPFGNLYHLLALRELHTFKYWYKKSKAGEEISPSMKTVDRDFHNLSSLYLLHPEFLTTALNSAEIDPDGKIYLLSCLLSLQDLSETSELVYKFVEDNTEEIFEVLKSSNPKNISSLVFLKEIAKTCFKLNPNEAYSYASAFLIVDAVPDSVRSTMCKSLVEKIVADLDDSPAEPLLDYLSHIGYTKSEAELFLNAKISGQYSIYALNEVPKLFEKDFETIMYIEREEKGG